MSDILTDLSDESLEKTIEENMYAMTPLTHGWPGAETYSGKDVTWCVTDVGFPHCNPIMRVNLKPESVDGVLAMLTDKARKKKINLNCWITKDTRPLNFADVLVKNGFSKAGEPTCMAIDLNNLNEGKRAPRGFSIVEVEDSATLKTWCEVTCASYGMPDGVMPSVLEWFSREMKSNQPFKLYLGLLKGKPAATSLYFLGEGVCGIYFVGTLPEARNKGIGFSITQKPLMDAKRIGYRAGILQASAMGKPIYLELGFREYGKLQSYSWIYERNAGVRNGKQLH